MLGGSRWRPARQRPIAGEDGDVAQSTTPDVAQTRAALRRLRPDLAERFEAALPGARAAVLSRLLGALDREPLPGLAARGRGGTGATIRAAFADGRVVVEFPAAAARPFAQPAPGLSVRLTAAASRPDGPDLHRTATAPRPGAGPAGQATTGDRAPAHDPEALIRRLRAASGRPASGRAAGHQPASEDAGALINALRVADDNPATINALRAAAEEDPGALVNALRVAAEEDPGALVNALRAADDDPSALINALGVVEDDPGALARILWPAGALAAEIDNSVANLALARAAHPAPPPGALTTAAGDPDGLGRLEQLVTDGHPLHPCCRTRGGMTVADVLAYAPEHRVVIRLRRLRVPPDRWHGDAPPLLYAHPWQADRLRDRYPWLVDDGETAPVRPLMSLRTVAPLDGGDHYKTAVDVQMTSAVRTVSPAAVHNGPRLSTLLAELTADLPLSVLGEYAAGAVIVDGEPRRHLAHLRREAPRTAPGETVLPLGALAVPGLLEQAAGADPYRWFSDLARILWTPLVTVLERGVALEAHGQNTLVVLRAGRPVRILYRDLGGVRVSARRLRAAGVEPPGLLGDLPSDDPAELRTKLAAASLGTVAAELITLLARLGADPARLWAVVAAAIRAAGTADVAPLLRDPLPVKATTAMRLAADPLDDLWASMDNPLSASP
jgi:hypothetical protein